MRRLVTALGERIPIGGSRRWLITLSSLIVVLVLLGAGAWRFTRWLLEQGARGAEIVTALALLVGMAAKVVALLVAVAANVGLFGPDLRSKPPEPASPPGAPPPSWLRAVVGWARAVVGWVRTHVPTVVGLLLVLSLVSTSRFWAAPLQVFVAGCKHATELRVLASADQLEPVRLLADRYQHWAQRYGCASVHPFVFALPTRQAQEALAAGWPDSALRDAGPRPDVWLADSTREVAQVRTKLPGAGGTAIATDVTVAWSPIVLGVPAASSGEPPGELPAKPPGGLSGPSWSELFQAIRSLDWDVVRPDPASSPAGEQGSALLYGGGTAVDRETARSIEQRVGRSLDRGQYPLGGSLDVLCRYRQLSPQRTAVVVPEQALARFNNGDPLGDTCDQREDQRTGDELLLAYYPADTRSLGLQFVRFDWSAQAQAAAATAFGEWLASAAGAQALADVGLRPSGRSPTSAGLLTARNGVAPDATFTRDSVPDHVLDATMAVHQSAQRRSRVLLALDSSGSMSALAGADQGSRFDAARLGVAGALTLMGEQDEFGLWLFPADPASPASSEIRQAVPIGPRDDLVETQPRWRATGAALNGIKPAGDTPLYRAIVDGVAAVGPSTETDRNALVVLTDGKDTTSGLTDAQVVDAVRDKGVRVFVVAVGEASCATAVLRTVTTATGGRCLDATVSSLDATLVELFGLLWSSRG